MQGTVYPYQVAICSTSISLLQKISIRAGKVTKEIIKFPFGGLDWNMQLLVNQDAV